MRALGLDGGAAAGVGLVLLAACGSSTDTSTGETDTLHVLAAASLTESFERLADTFEAEHPGVEVRLVLDSSTTLATQVTEGAPADVLATADARSMQLAVDAGVVEEPEVFATNQLVLVTPPDNSALITAIEDLDDPEVSYVACVETAPCGALAATLLAENGVTADPRSLEVDVKAVLARVTADEADAGLVYATDAFAARSDVTTWPVPGADDALAVYPIAVADQADEPDLAADWVELVLSEEGQEELARAAFGPPDGGAGMSWAG
jgi:molybdate transport system substrate-binding protein